MIRNLLLCLLLLSVLFLADGCMKKKIPLDEKQFAALLIEMHQVDGILAVNRGVRGSEELKNYAYYNNLFKKHGITRAEFDSCMYYYSAQTVAFSKMYDVIIDSLNKQLTTVDKVLAELKSKDSVNYLPLIDTLRLDSIHEVIVDSIVPGLYKFSTTLQFDSVSTNRNRRISSFFLSADEKDTLKVRDITVVIDTLNKTYSWSQYADSLYSRLVIRYMEIIPLKDRPKVYKNGKEVKAKKEKEIDLKEFGGRSWDNQLFRPYISRETEKRLKQGLRYR